MFWVVPASLSFLSCFFVALFYRFRRGQHELFSRMGLPGPTPHWVRGNLKEIKQAPLLHELLIDWRNEYGKTYGYYEGPTPVIVTSDLDIIRSVFIKQFNNFHGRKLFAMQPDPEDPKTNHMFTARGNKWKRLRSIIVPTFSCSRLKQMLPVINAKVDILLHQMAIHSLRKDDVNMLDTFQALTMEIIGSAAFGMELNSQTNPNEPFLNKAKDMLEIFEKASLIRTCAEYFPELRPWLVNTMSGIVKMTNVTPAPLWFLKNLADVIAMRKMESQSSSDQPKRVDMMQLMLDAEVDDKLIQDGSSLTMNTSLLHETTSENQPKPQQYSNITMSSEDQSFLTMSNSRTKIHDKIKVTDPSIVIDISDNNGNNVIPQKMNNVTIASITYPDNRTGHSTKQDGSHCGNASNEAVSESVRKGHDDICIQNHNHNIRSLKRSLKKLTNEEIKGQSFLFLVAGYETTAHTLSFIAYLLALHPDIQEKLQKEVDENLSQESTVSYELLNKMEYMEMVVLETLRLYPVTNVVVNRLCMKDTIVGDLVIKQGTVVQANVVDLHMDPNIWGHDPKAFNPERFSAEKKALRDPLAYMPFGVGPRNCVGMRFALLEVKQALVRLVKHFSFVPCEKTQVPLRLKEIPALTPIDGIYLRVEERNKV